jgi:UDP-3-O-acyl N-acetylglucosamine deacetylase
VTVALRPAPPGSGIVFLRTDAEPPRRIPATVRQRIEVPRRTTLAGDGTQVEMVEHLLAALFGLGIDNCEVAASAGEMPGLDGSCLPVVEAIAAAGTVEQNVPRQRLIVTEITRVGDEQCWVEARPARTNTLTIEYKLDYGPNSPIGRQAIELAVTPTAFVSELAPARTFILEDEAAWLKSRGLGARVTHQDLLVFGPDGPLDNALRFENECVRHKALDLVGDLALAGCDLVGRIIAYRSGHRLNAELVKVLLSEGRMEGALRRTA